MSYIMCCRGRTVQKEEDFISKYTPYLHFNSVVLRIPRLCFTHFIICSLGEEPVKITKEASRDKFQMRF